MNQLFGWMGRADIRGEFAFKGVPENLFDRNIRFFLSLRFLNSLDAKGIYSGVFLLSF